jgi:hypothetical protein
MALIQKQKESSFSRWYKANRERVLAKRKQRYAQDPEYRQRAVEASRRRRRGEVAPTTPPDDAPISFREAVERVGVSGSALHSWRRHKLFPEPKRYGGQLWFSQQQVLLLKHLKDRVYGKRRWYMKSDRFKEVIASIRDNWA